VRPLELVTRDPLLKLTALVLAFLLWALVETGGRSGPAGPAAGRRAPDSLRAAPEPAPATRDLPVAVRVTGQVPGGFELAGPPVVDPARVTLRGPAGALERIDSVRLSAIPLDSLTVSRTFEVPIDSASLRLSVHPQVIRVTILIRPVPADSGGGRAEPPKPAPPPAGTRP
jgi:hypothetical protein